MSTFRIDQLGVLFRARLYDSGASSAVDLSSASALSIEFQRPDGTRFTKSAAVTTPPGTDGYVQFENADPDDSVFDMAGAWKYRARVTFTDADLLIGSWITFTVET